MTNHTHHTAHDYTPMPWKNGGGTTYQIARHDTPTGDFAWRISMADVAQDGAFSDFSGKKRLLAILCGDGLALTINHRHQTLSTGQVLAFDGSDSVFARLVGGAVIDFNLIYDPTHHHGTMVWASTGDTLAISPTAFVIASCPTTLTVDDHAISLDPYDCLKISAPSQLGVITGQVCVAHIHKI